MARIPVYEAKKLLTTDGSIDTHLTDYVGRATESLGSSISSAAESFGNRMEQRENFKAQNDLQRFKLDRNQDLLDQSTNAMPEGGIGFHDSFMGSFKTKRDEFLKKVPARLRDQFAAQLDDKDGPIFGEFSNAAAKGERDETVRWATTQVSATQEQLASALNMNPEKYDEILKTGNDLIDSMPMTAPSDKLKFKKDWENMAQIAHLAALQEQDPELVLKALGANPNRLSPTTQYSILEQAVMTQESNGDPNAVSNKGAIGLMQVMPGTARDIAKEIGDKNFPVKGDPYEVAQYLAQPHVNKAYGSFYLKKMQRMFPGDLEAALIGYHSGPGNAKKWVEAGRSDAVLGPEGRAYYKEVIARLPGKADTGTGAVETNLPPIADANAFLKTRLVGHVGDRLEIDGLQPGLQSRVAALFQAAPPEIAKGLGIFSGHRTREEQERLFAKSDKTGHWVARPGHSNHEGGAAADLSFNGKSLKDAPKAVVDWVHANAEKFGLKFPLGHENWHVEMQETRGGKPPAHLNGRYASLPFDKRQQFIVGADNALTQRLTQQKQADSVARVQLNNDIQTELATIRATGVPSGNLDENAIQVVLGDDDLVKYADKKQEAIETFTATSGMKTMTPDELGDRLDDYKADPAGVVPFDRQQRVEAAVLKEADRITKLRASHPDKAALEDPIVKQAEQKVMTGIASGQAQPADMQNFIQLMIQRQKDFGVNEKALAPVPREWAFQIAKAMQRVPNIGKDTKPADVRAAVAVQYDELHKQFGDYTDDVIIYSLQQYKQMDKNTAELVTNMMTSIANGGNPFKSTMDLGDQAQVDTVTEKSWLQQGSDWLFGDGTQADAPPADVPAGTPPSRELVQRATDAMSDEMYDPSTDEAILVERYGQAAVDAAKLTIEKGAQ